jgi:hypothetical protein
LEVVAADQISIEELFITAVDGCLSTGLNPDGFYRLCLIDPTITGAG